MRLTYNNIKSVKECSCQGITYEYIVTLKSNIVSDTRIYINYDNRDGRYITVLKEYKKDWLPAMVQKFINNHTRETFIKEKDNNIIWYIYQ